MVGGLAVLALLENTANYSNGFRAKAAKISSVEEWRTARLSSH